MACVASGRVGPNWDVFFPSCVQDVCLRERREGLFPRGVQGACLRTRGEDFCACGGRGIRSRKRRDDFGSVISERHDWRVVLQQANPAELHKSGVHLVLDDAPAMRVQITRADMLDSKEGIIRRMENLLPKLPGAADSREARAADLDRRVEDVATRIGQPFPHAQALEEARLLLTLPNFSHYKTIFNFLANLTVWADLFWDKRHLHI